MQRRTKLLSAIFYGVLIVVLALILADRLKDLLPATLARRIGFNSEGYLFALVVAAWIQFVRPRLRPSRVWPVTAGAAVVCLAVATFLYNSDLPSRFKTLNETFFALVLVVPYLMLRRPLPRTVLLVPPFILAGVVVAMTVAPEGLVVDLAETYGYWMLIPLVLDLVDPAILDPDARTSTRLRGFAYAVMVAIPVTVSALGTEERQGTGIHLWLSYIGRIHESFIGVLLVALFFAVGLRRTGPRADGALRPEVAATR